MASTLDNVNFPLARQNLNTSITALDSFNFGANAPNPTRPYQAWVDTSGILRVRSADNNSWVIAGDLSKAFFGLTGANISLSTIAGMTATQVQAAIAELQTAKVAKQRPNWTSITLFNGFVAFGAGTAVPAYRRLDSGEVQLKGLIRRSVMPPSGTFITSLPAEFAPNEIVHISSSTGGAEAGSPIGTGAGILEIHPDGSVRYLNGAVSGFFNLNASYFQS